LLLLCYKLFVSYFASKKDYSPKIHDHDGNDAGVPRGPDAA
jgi:hypothetical protein